MKKSRRNVAMYGASFAAAVLSAAAAAQASQVFSDPLYVAATYNGPGQVIEYDTSGAAAATISTVTTRGNNATDLSFDSQGNVYVDYYGTSDIYEVPASGGAGTTFATFSSNPFASAFDGQGNLYVTGYGNRNIVEYSPLGTPTTFATNVTGGGFLVGAAFDTSGDLFVSVNNGNSSAILKYTASGGVLGSTPTTIASHSTDSVLTSPWQIAVDSSGNVFVVNDGLAGVTGTSATNAVLELSPSGTTYAASTFVSGLDFDRGRGLAFDDQGDLFVSAFNGSTDVIQQIGSDGTAVTPVTVVTTPFTGGINEIAFDIPSSAPEPATAGLVIVGGAALTLRRRRAVAHRAASPGESGA